MLTLSIAEAHYNGDMQQLPQQDLGVRNRFLAYLFDLYQRSVMIISNITTVLVLLDL